VIADSVNPLAVMRDAWAAVANRASAQVLEVGIVCLDEEEHRRPVETGSSDVPGPRLPPGNRFRRATIAHGDRPRLVVDTAARSAEAALAEVLARPARAETMDKIT
jgi:hypothetical protein